jgi:predicted MFS family arabinose efflux permease
MGARTTGSGSEQRSERPDARGTDSVGRFSWRIALTSVLTITVGILPGFLPGALAVQLADSLGIDVAGVGIIVGGFFGVSAVVSSLMGRVVERIGWGPAMRFAALGSGITLGLTPIVATSILSLGVVTIVGGAALALAHPSVNLALARCTGSGRQGIAYGFKHAAIPAASGLAGLALPLIALPLGWRWVYGLAAALAMLTILTVPGSTGSFEVNRPRSKSTTAPGRSSPLPVLVVLAVGAGLGIFGMDGLATFLVPYAVDVGFAEGAAGVLLAAGSGCGIAMRLVAGWWIDRRASASLVIVAAFLAVGAAAIGLLATGAPAAVVAGSLVAFAFGWGWSGLLTFSVVRLNPAAPAAATGITMTGIYVGAATGPAVLGILADAVSYTVAWTVMAAALAVGAVLVWMAIARVADPSG